MPESDSMPPAEWIREWTKELISRDTSKGEACRSIARRASSWGYSRGLEAGQALGAAEELEKCCAQISQCHMIPAEQREQIAAYLHEIRSSAPQ